MKTQERILIKNIIMKRAKCSWNQIAERDNIKLAHQKASKGKSWYPEVKRVNENLDEHIDKLLYLLQNNLYKTSEYKKETRLEGSKIRNIYKLPYYPDRIAQWAVFQTIGPEFIKGFIYQTYSAIPNRGIHLALNQVKKALKDKENTKYCLKCDISKYYESINHDILKDKLKRKFKDKQILNFLYEIIDSIDTHWKLPDTGIPIGNFSSQYFGNFYLNDFDHWIKEEKHCTYYFRYMDDFIILSNNKEELHKIRIKIDRYLSKELKLTLKSNWQIFPVEDRGIDFVGYVIKHDYIKLRKGIKTNILKRRKKVNKKRCIRFKDYCSFYSDKGWLKHCNSYNLYCKHFYPLEIHMNQYHTKIIRGINK